MKLTVLGRSDGRLSVATRRSGRVLTSRSRVDSLVPSRGCSVLELVLSHSLCGKVGVALIEGSRVVVGGHVPVATHNVIDCEVGEKEES